jgi:homoserine dehydrogenase
MYILYGNINGWKELIRSDDELDIINKLNEHINTNEQIKYFVTLSNGKNDFIVKFMNTMEDYVDYIYMARQRGFARKRSK